MKCLRNYLCDCGFSKDTYCDWNDTIICDNCQEVMYQDMSKKNIFVDQTFIGGMFESSSHRRRFMKESGNEQGSYDEVVKHNNRIKSEKYNASKSKFLNKTRRTAEFLAKNKNVSRQISAEIKNTGKSAMAKKISEEI